MPTLDFYQVNRVSRSYNLPMRFERSDVYDSNDRMIELFSNFRLAFLIPMYNFCYYRFNGSPYVVFSRNLINRKLVIFDK